MLNAECFCFASNKSGVVVRLYNIFTTSGAERSSESRRQARDQEDEEEENDANAVNRGLVKHPKDWPWSSFSFLQKGRSGVGGNRSGGHLVARPV